MGQIVLLVVAAAWAAVLVPPLLRSRVENRPNSSVSDFRSQLSSLQRVLPSRGASVRSMARPLAPSTLTRPAASGRPPLRSGLGSNHTAQPAPPARTTSRDATRGHEPTARPRRHAERPERAPVVMRNGRPVLDAAEIKRRRTKVLYLIAGTAAVSGLMAATTDSKAMVYLFAVAVVALGAYVYLLAIANQRSLVDDPDYADERDARDLYEAPPASRRSYRYDDDSDTYYGADTRALGRDRDDSAAYRSTARSVEPSAGADTGDHTPGMGTSGRISYGRRPAPQPARSDAYGFETYDRSEPVRRPPARNGRHPTGQHPAVQRPREPQPVRRGYFPQTG